MIFESTYIRYSLSVWRPDWEVSIPRETTRSPAQRRGYPDISPVSSVLETEKRSEFDETGTRGTSRDKSNPGTVGREGGLDVLTGIIGDVHFLPTFDSPDVYFKVAGTIGGESQKAPIGRPSGPLGQARVVGEPG
jgi:hypothetical protein